MQGGAGEIATDHLVDGNSQLLGPRSINTCHAIALDATRQYRVDANIEIPSSMQVTG